MTRLDDLVREIRDAGDQGGADVEATRLRVRRSLDVDARGRRGLASFATGLALICGGTAAWAFATGRAGELWHDLRAPAKFPALRDDAPATHAGRRAPGDVVAQAVPPPAAPPDAAPTNAAPTTRTNPSPMPAAPANVAPTNAAPTTRTNSLAESRAVAPTPTTRTNSSVESPAAAPSRTNPSVESPTAAPAPTTRTNPSAESPRAPESPAAPPPVSAPAVDPLYRRAHELHFHGSDLPAALAAWDAYLAAEPDGRFAAEARYNRALVLIKLTRYREARAALAPFARGEVGAAYRRDEAAKLIARLAQYE